MVINDHLIELHTYSLSVAYICIGRATITAFGNLDEDLVIPIAGREKEYIHLFQSISLTKRADDSTSNEVA